ncbi:hypothetical protein V501_02228 [Pseudogymnoascus sp. VKM F-4519 (FW-2642)]|nr:hypothetical protein V501_02228 [Pseudogymnoascus sp. VKM F-4519 (FW-2642)]
MKLSYILYASLAAINTVMAADHTEICLSNPEATIQAGSVATATIDNPLGKACEATVEFANSDFLPLHFGLKRIRCDGLQLGQITIPLEAPNGDARILWLASKTII